MPGLSGPELAQRLALARPEISVLFMSGYSGDALARHGALSPGRAVLPKPFGPETLLTKVRQVLAGRRIDAHTA